MRTYYLVLERKKWAFGKKEKQSIVVNVFKKKTAMDVACERKKWITRYLSESRSFAGFVYAKRKDLLDKDCLTPDVCCLDYNIY